MCTSTDIGDVCVFEESVNTFKRVQIRCIQYDRDCSKEMKFVDVKCIDSGIIYQRVDVRSLFLKPLYSKSLLSKRMLKAEYVHLYRYIFYIQFNVDAIITVLY